MPQLDKTTMTKRALWTLLLVGTAAAGLAGAAHAQYDRDGRYVPSPMGVPRDPYAKPIPMYPGTPGGASGTPIVPRGAMPPPVRVPEMKPRVETPTYNSTPVPALTRAQCEEGWSASTGVPKVEFNRRCKRMRAVK